MVHHSRSKHELQGLQLAGYPSLVVQLPQYCCKSEHSCRSFLWGMDWVWSAEQWGMLASTWLVGAIGCLHVSWPRCVCVLNPFAPAPIDCTWSEGCAQSFLFGDGIEWPVPVSRHESVIDHVHDVDVYICGQSSRSGAEAELIYSTGMKFLRTHRLLTAMSQRPCCFQVFGGTTGI